MKKKCWILLSVFVLTLACSSCGSEESIDSAVITSSVPISESIDYTTATDSGETTPTPTMTIVIRGDSFYFINALMERYYLPDMCCLRSEESATLISEDFTVDAPTETGRETVLIPAGTIMLPKADIIGDEISTEDEAQYKLFDGRLVSFAMSRDKNGTVTLNGKKLSDFFVGHQDIYDPSVTDPEEWTPPVIEEEGILLPMTPLDSQYQNLTIKVDWNGDGKEDTFRRECPDPEHLWEQTVTYTDGATGETTDITEKTAIDGRDEHVGFSNSIFLYLDESGKPVLLDVYDDYSCDYCTAAYTYDPDPLISYTGADVFSIIDGKVYLFSGIYLFGNNVTGTICPATFDGKAFYPVATNIDLYFDLNENAEKDGEDLPNFFTCPIREVYVE